MNSDPESTFAHLLRTYRRAAYLTQEDLAERARLSVRAISDLERGINRAPRNDTLALLAKALGLHGKERVAFKAAARGRADVVFVPKGGPGGTEPPLIGRQRELAMLEWYLSGHGPPVLMLAGEPGIGKSHLLRTVAVQAPRHGLRVLAGGCRRSGVQTPYSPLLETLRHLLQGLEGDARSRILHDCAWLVRLLPELQDGPIEPLPPWSLPPDQEKRLMVDAVKQLLVNAAGPNGTLLILDDLQWARVDALDLLASLALSSDKRTLSIVGAYRDTEVKTGDPLFHFLADLTQTGAVSLHSIGPLPVDDAGQLLRELVGSKPGSLLVDRVVEQAGGVPFFLVNLAHLLQEDPGDGVADGYAHLRKSALPWTLVQAVRQRVTVLGEDVANLLGVASVIGRIVPRALLGRILDQSVADLLPLLETACQARLLVEDGLHGYQFSHDVIREVLEADLSTARRTLLHGRVADALAADSAESPVEKIAFHYSQTEDHAAAALWLERAGDRAGVALAQDSALEFYRAALDRVRMGKEASAALSRLHEKLGDIYRLRLDFDSALTAFAGALALEFERSRRADLLRKEGVVKTAKGNHTGALAAFAAAELEGGSELHATVRAALYTDRAFCHYITGNYTSAASESERAINLLNDCAELREEGRILAAALWVDAVIYDIKGDVETARARMERLLVHAQRLGDQQFLGRASFGLAVCAWREGYLDEAETRFLSAQEVISRAADLEYTVGSNWGLGCVAFSRGDLASAQYRFRLALDTSNLAQHAFFSALMSEELGKVACGQGDLDAAQEWFQTTLTVRESVGDERGIAQSLNGLGMVACERGNYGEAAARFRRARRIARRRGALYAELDALIGRLCAAFREMTNLSVTTRRLQFPNALLACIRHRLAGHTLPEYEIQVELLSAELQLAQGMVAQARKVANDLLQWSTQLGLTRQSAASSLLLGRCAASEGDDEEAESRLTSALSLFTQRGFKLDAAHVMRFLSSVRTEKTGDSYATPFVVDEDPKEYPSVCNYNPA